MNDTNVYIVVDLENGNSIEGVFKRHEDALTRLRSIADDSDIEQEDMDDDEVVASLEGLVEIQQHEVLQ